MNKQFDDFDREAEREASAISTLCKNRVKPNKKYYKPYFKYGKQLDILASEHGYNDLDELDVFKEI